MSAAMTAREFWADDGKRSERIAVVLTVMAKSRNAKEGRFTDENRLTEPTNDEEPRVPPDRKGSR